MKKLLIIGSIRRGLLTALSKKGNLELKYLDNPELITLEIPYNDTIFFNEEAIKVSDYDAVLMTGARPLYQTAYKILTDAGVNVIGNPFSRMTAGDKWWCATVCNNKGINLARTFYSTANHLDSTAFALLGGDVVVKPVDKSLGIGVKLINEEENHSQTKRQLYQEYINTGGKDERWIVVNGKLVCAMQRTQNKEGEFRANLFQGATGTNIPVTEEMQELGEKVYELFPDVIYFGMDVFRVKDSEGNTKFILNELNPGCGERIIHVSNHNFYEDVAQYIYDRLGI